LNQFQRCRQTPFFLDASAFRLFCLHFQPPAHAPSVGAILHVPAFAEEMNKSRRAIALTARALAERGWNVLVVDPRGVGDSEGDFCDASWSGWLDDLEASFRWLEKTSKSSPVLWGLRAGGLLACELSVRVASPQLVLWQPILAGETALSQFLRLRTVASLDAPPDKRETVKSLMERLSAGERLEVAGYLLSPELALSLRASRLSALQAVPPRIAWIEVEDRAEADLSPAGRSIVDRWRTAGALVTASAVTGAPFWTTVETDEGQAATVAMLATLSSKR
jgi:uncharacterized protein